LSAAFAFDFDFDFLPLTFTTAFPTDDCPFEPASKTASNAPDDAFSRSTDNSFDVSVPPEKKRQLRRVLHTALVSGSE